MQTIEQSNEVTEERNYRAERAARVAAGEVRPWLVFVLGISRRPGGREEGGWYYDATRILEVRKVWSIGQAKRAIKALREEYPQPRYNRFSVCGDEDIVIGQVAHVDDLPQETERPRYE